MNTLTDWKITAKILDPDRRAWWLRWLGVDEVPIESVLTVRVQVPISGVVDAYMLDLEALDPEMKIKLIDGIAQTFGLPREVVAGKIDLGVPIPAEGVFMTCRDQGIFFSMLDDFEAGLDDRSGDDYLDEFEDAW